MRTIKKSTNRVLTIFLTFIAISSFAKVVTTSEIKVNSIIRSIPTTSTTSATEVIYRVTFNNDVLNVDTTDFSISGAATGTVSSVTKISDAIYDITINSITGTGSLELKIKGVDGASGSNDIQEVAAVNEVNTITQNETDDYLNQAEIGQTFIATTNNTLTAITIYKKSGNHTFNGTANLKILLEIKMLVELN